MSFIFVIFVQLLQVPRLYFIMDFIICILGKIIGAFILLGLIGWLVSFFRAIAGLARGESFSFFLPFGFISSKRNNRP